MKARVGGAIRPNATLVPQRAVLQGAKSHFVWVVGNDGKAHQRVVEVGEWQGDNWFVSDGLKAGERIVVDGALRVTADSQLKIVKELPAVKDSAAVATAASQSGAAAAPAAE